MILKAVDFHKGRRFACALCLLVACVVFSRALAVNLTIPMMDEPAVLNAAPEHDACAALARASGVPPKQIYTAAIAAWHRRGS